MRDVAAENHEEFVSVENVNSKGKHIINSNIHSVIGERADIMLHARLFVSSFRKSKYREFLNLGNLCKHMTE